MKEVEETITNIKRNTVEVIEEQELKEKLKTFHRYQYSVKGLNME